MHSKTNNFIYWGLYVLVWLIFVGLSIEAGGLLVNFFFSLYNPEMVHNLYQKLDLSEMYATNRFAFYGIYSFIITNAVLKAVMFYIVIRLMHTMKLSQPFTRFVSTQILRISYFTLVIGLLSYIARQWTNNLMHRGYTTTGLNQFLDDSEAFIVMGAVVYIIATIFKKGIELQEENDLTV